MAMSASSMSSDAIAQAASSGALSHAQAMLTRAVHVPSVLSSEEIQQLDALYARIRAEEDEVSGGKTDCFQHPNLCGALRDSEHHTCFLHVDHLIDRELPHIIEKVLTVMRRADAEQGWGQLSGRAHNIRVCEYHEYTVGGEVCDPRHRDGGSLVTSSILLADTDTFTGGDFTMLEFDEETVTEFDQFRRGDALVFCSEKWHSVQEVESGTRCSLVTELWAGPRCVVDRND